MGEKRRQLIDRIKQCTHMQLLGGKVFSSVVQHQISLIANVFRSQLSRSTKSLHMPWYQRPLVKNNQYMNIQKGAIIMSVLGIVSSSAASDDSSCSC